MAALFISCTSEDNRIGKAIQARLAGKGHRTTLPVGIAIAGEWRTKVTRALSSSQVLISILTENGLGSRYVLGEVGAGRVLSHTRGMLLLPVLKGDMQIPDFVNDIFCFRLPGEDDSNLDLLVQELDQAIIDHVKLVPRIFISHRHKDEPVAAALVALLEEAFFIGRTDIRCTSVQPYMLTPGERTSEQLRTEIAGAELVIGILSPDTTESNYVLCELGASWGRDIPTFPVMARGATPADIPSPLNERHSVSLESEETCLQLVEYMASKTSLQRREGSMSKIVQNAKLLANAAKERNARTSSTA